MGTRKSIGKNGTGCTLGACNFHFFGNVLRRHACHCDFDLRTAHLGIFPGPFATNRGAQSINKMATGRGDQIGFARSWLELCGVAQFWAQGLLFLS